MNFKTVFLCIILLLTAGQAWSETSDTLPGVVRKVISENPEVQATWHAFLAATEQQDGARGGYYPHLDLSASTGWENWQMNDSSDNDFTRSNVALSLRQMVFDGFATHNEVARLGYAKLVRYYEVLAASENVGLEAIRAYLEVLRYRDLKKLAVENFVQHRIIFNQVQERTKAGLSRGVDLEQANGRLALAESNLITEITNLHDVSTRYLRIVGEAPPTQLIPPKPLTDSIPSDRKTALKLAFQKNPSFNAAVENVRAAEAQRKARKSPFMPQVDFHARQNFGQTTNDQQSREDETIVELVLNYNLFSGGSDSAARRQSLHQLNVAKNLREKACRDVRQNLSIAYNDKDALKHQLRYLNEHQLSAEKARKAYRDQFDIGQRTLLDLLDTENEYFEARRAYISTNYDYTLAHARTLASMGQLLKTLKVSREALPSLVDIGQDRFGIDPDAICAPETIEAKIEFPPIPVSKTVTPPIYGAEKNTDGDDIPNHLDACPETPVGTAVDKFGCPEVLPERVSFQINVLFPFASAEVPADFMSELFRLGEFLKKHPDLKLSVEGHTDSVGSSEYNQQLSQKRAANIVKIMKQKHGIQPERLIPIGFGESRPIADNDNAEGRRQNRRVVATTTDTKS